MRKYSHEYTIITDIGYNKLIHYLYNLNTTKPFNIISTLGEEGELKSEIMLRE